MYLSDQDPAEMQGPDADDAELHACAFEILQKIVENRALDPLNFNESGITTITPVESLPRELLGRYVQLCQQHGLDVYEAFTYFRTAAQKLLGMRIDAKLMTSALDSAWLELHAFCTNLTLVFD